MADVKSTCETCVFWLNQTIIGTCRRFPTYQHRSKNEWCGEHKALEAFATEPIVESAEQVAEEPRQKRKYTRRQNAETAE